MSELDWENDRGVDEQGDDTADVAVYFGKHGAPKYQDDLSDADKKASQKRQEARWAAARKAGMTEDYPTL